MLLVQEADRLTPRLTPQVIFVICFAPYHAVTLWFFLYPNATEEYNGWWHALRIAGFVLSFLNSCVNPVALYFVSGQFRKYFNRYLFNVPVATRRGSSRTRVHFHSINTATQLPASDDALDALGALGARPGHLDGHLAGYEVVKTGLKGGLGSSLGLGRQDGVTAVTAI